MQYKVKFTVRFHKKLVSFVSYTVCPLTLTSLVQCEALPQIWNFQGLGNLYSVSPRDETNKKTICQLNDGLDFNKTTSNLFFSFR